MKDHSQVTLEKDLAQHIPCEANELAGTIVYLVQKKLVRRVKFSDSFRRDDMVGKKVQEFFPLFRYVAGCQPATFKRDCDEARKQDGLEDGQFYLKITTKGIDAIENEELGGIL